MLIYYFTRDWSITMWILTIYVMPFLCYYWCVPESARWLVSTGQLLQARKVLHRIAYINRRTLANADKKLYDDLQREARIRPKRYSYTYVLISLFKSPVMRQRCLIIFYIMMTNLMVYLGIGMGITGLTSDRPYEILSFLNLRGIIRSLSMSFLRHEIRSKNSINSLLHSLFSLNRYHSLNSRKLSIDQFICSVMCEIIHLCVTSIIMGIHIRNLPDSRSFYWCWSDS